MELFAKTINGWKSLIISTESFILDILTGFEIRLQKYQKAIGKVCRKCPYSKGIRKIRTRKSFFTADFTHCVKGWAPFWDSYLKFIVHNIRCPCDRTNVKTFSDKFLEGECVLLIFIKLWKENFKNLQQTELIL